MCGLWMTLARAASPSAVAHLAALASGLSGLVTAPLVSGPLCVCCPAALTGDLFLLRCIHGCEAASDCCHCCHLLELYGQQVVPRGDTPCGRASNLLRLLYRMTSFRADAKKRPESVSGRNSRGFASLILWSGATGVPADRRTLTTYTPGRRRVTPSRPTSASHSERGLCSPNRCKTRRAAVTRASNRRILPLFVVNARSGFRRAGPGRYRNGAHPARRRILARSDHAHHSPGRIAGRSLRI